MNLIQISNTVYINTHCISEITKPDRFNDFSVNITMNNGTKYTLKPNNPVDARYIPNVMQLIS